MTEFLYAYLSLSVVAAVIVILAVRGAVEMDGDE